MDHCDGTCLRCNDLRKILTTRCLSAQEGLTVLWVRVSCSLEFFNLAPRLRMAKPCLKSKHSRSPEVVPHRRLLRPLRLNGLLYTRHTDTKNEFPKFF
jgi:hypothetical protein